MFFDRSSDRPSPYRPLMGLMILTLLVGAAGTLFTEPSIPTWYAALAKPDFSPPNWLFAPVWTTLYILMAIAAWRVWRIVGLRPASPLARSASKGEVAVAGSRAGEGRRGINKEMAAWGVQLLLNFLWTPLFFGAHLILLALVEMALLWLAILATLILFWRKDRIAGLLFVPYLAWVSFAFALNLAIWRLNGA